MTTLICNTHGDVGRYSNGSCKKCHTEKAKLYKQKNKELLKSKRIAKYLESGGKLSCPCKICGGVIAKKNGCCLECSKTKWRIYWSINKEKISESSSNWRKNNPDKVLKNTKEWQKNNPEKTKKSAKQSKALSKKNLTDYYVRTTIYGVKKNLKGIIKFSDIPPELVEIKRLQMQLNHAIKVKLNSI